MTGLKSVAGTLRKEFTRWIQQAKNIKIHPCFIHVHPESISFFSQYGNLQNFWPLSFQNSLLSSCILSIAETGWVRNNSSVQLATLNCPRHLLPSFPALSALPWWHHRTPDAKNMQGATVDGRNPAPVVICSLSHYLQGLCIPGGAGFLPSTVCASDHCAIRSFGASKCRIFM